MRYAATFDGTNDSGSVKKPVFHPSPAVELPFGLAEELRRCWWLPSGWEINAGSSGTLTLDVATGKVSVDIEWRDEDDEPEEEME